MDDVTAAIAQERLLLDPAVRSDPRSVARMLASDFSEIGRSGRRWSRDEMIAALAADPGVESEASGFRGRTVADGLVLVEYQTTDARGTAHRTSLWRRTDDGWQVAFHQGTPVG